MGGAQAWQIFKQIGSGFNLGKPDGLRAGSRLCKYTWARAAAEHNLAHEHPNTRIGFSDN